MDDVFAITLASMHQDMSRLDRVAMNLANASTPGYKREVVASRPFVEVLEDVASQGSSMSSGQSAPAGMPASSQMKVLFDVHPGTVKVTGEAMDVAITGDAFFEISTEQGPAYTRQGDFHLDARGRLVTAQGHPVMGRNGEIFLTTQAPSIDATGAITEPNATTGPSAAAPGSPVAQLKLVRFEDAKTLQRLGDGLMAAGSGMTVLNGTESQVRQGALENSNISTLQEMVQMMQTARHFETIQKITQGYDEMIGTAIHKLGDLS
ncbi:MAG TPA: flagellar hook-basal body protein [Geothrix sp.]|nr:flagellar hook-basal body protein [Geothrix sp.]